MKKENRLPFAGAIASGAMSGLVIHFWLADLYASWMDIPFDTAYARLMVLLIMLTTVRSWLTAKGKDRIANWFEGRGKNKNKVK